METEKNPDSNLIIKNGRPSPEMRTEEKRDTWSGKLDFVMSTLSFAVGMGNMWRFPYLVYKDGGGAFLIPYVIMVVLVGFPLLYLEFVFGQYGKKGIVSIWNACPIFSGIGWSMFAVTFGVAVYYNVLISWCFYYIFSAFARDVPWRNCGNSWNTAACVQDIHNHISGVANNCSNSNNSCIYSETVQSNLSLTLVNNVTLDLKSPSDEFFHHNMLDLSSGLDSVGLPRWQLVLCLLLTWTILVVCLSRGIQSSGKVAYVTSLFPYVILLVLFVRGLTLEGWTKGVYYYFVPTWEKLLSPKVWGDAAVQVFFTMSVCWGGQITLASYNQFNHNSFRDAVVICMGDTLTSIFGGVVIFSYIGYMATALNVPVDEVATQGAGLAFIVYPQAVTMLPFSQLWAVLFMLMLVNVGLGTSFGLVQTLTATLTDMFPFLSRGRRPLLLLISLCLVLFLLGLQMTTRGGIYILQLLDSFVASYTTIFLGITMSLALSWVYGWDRLSENIKEMSGSRPSIFFRIMWQCVTPILCLLILVLYVSNYTRTSYGDYTLPLGAEILGWVICLFEVGLIPAVALYKILTCNCKGGFMEKVRYVCRPDAEWGSHARSQRPEYDLVNMTQEMAELSKIDSYQNGIGHTTA